MTTPARRLGALILALSLVPFVSPAVAQQWTLLSPGGSLPVARYNHSAVYDAGTDTMIVFGGRVTTSCTTLNDTWILEDASDLSGTPAWTQLAPTGSLPPARQDHSAVYDPVGNRMIIFGGDQSAGCGGASLLNDVWVLSNANGQGGTPAWTHLTPTGGLPSARAEQSAVYDTGGNRLILFGGNPNVGSCFNTVSDVWVLTNANGSGPTPVWTTLLVLGQDHPIAGTTVPCMTSRTIGWWCLGGNEACAPALSIFNDVWVLADANGASGTPTWAQLVVSPAILRSSHTGVYNAGLNQMTIFGGHDGTAVVDETWVLTNANGLGSPASWTQLNPTSSPPVGKALHSAVLNEATNRMIVFSGQGVSVNNDTNVLEGPPSVDAGPDQALTADVFAQADVTLTATGAGNDPVSLEWFLGGGAAPSGLVRPFDGRVNAQPRHLPV